MSTADVHPYASFAERLQASGYITDPWLDGQPRFRAQPVVLSKDQHHTLCKTGEDLALVIEEAIQLLCEDPDQLAAFVPMMPAQQAMWQHAAGAWHGLARADVFFTADGVQITELNSDTPTGEPEAMVLGALATADHDGVDACAGLLSSLARLWRSWHVAGVDESSRNRVAAIVYPTEFTEDLSLVRLYRQLLEEMGFAVVLGSPFNLQPDPAGVTLFGQRPTLVVRHYKTDWWGERQPVWLDDNVADAQPLWQPLQALLQAEANRQCAVMNPFGAMVSQNKRLMAFCWERIHRFPVASQRIIEAIVPYTARLETMHPAQLLGDRANWVLKSDYGAEGDEVIIGKLVDDNVWQQSLQQARPGRWVAQRYFEALRDDDGHVHNHGVFVVAGEACGVYTRLDRGHTDAASLSVATLVR
jgi:glutathionylspermidine synthase